MWFDYLQSVTVSYKWSSRPACHVLCAGDRKSKRARKGRAPIRVSALETIRDLKLKIVQTLSIHPQNAALHVLQAGIWQPLTDDAASLAGKLSLHCILNIQEIHQSCLVLLSYV